MSAFRPLPPEDVSQVVTKHGESDGETDARSLFQEDVLPSVTLLHGRAIVDLQVAHGWQRFSQRWGRSRNCKARSTCGPGGRGRSGWSAGCAVTGSFAGIRDKVERAFRNGERLHLDPAQVRVLVQSPLFPMLAELAAKEFAEGWREEVEQTVQKMVDGSSSAPSGCTGGPIGTAGSFAGTTTAAVDAALESAARRRALSTVKGMGARRNPR